MSEKLVVPTMAEMMVIGDRVKDHQTSLSKNRRSVSVMINAPPARAQAAAWDPPRNKVGQQSG